MWKKKGERESVCEKMKGRKKIIKKLFVVWIVNKLLCLFVIHTWKKNYILPILLDTKNDS
jgi:hypothetical protein